MKKSMAGLIGIVVLGGMMGASAGQGDVRGGESSGFLRDYSSLQEMKDAEGKTYPNLGKP